MSDGRRTERVVLEEVTRGLVHLHRRFYGKGPTEARTYAVNDAIMCMLKGGFTTVERTLIDDGRSEDVENIRRSFQRTMQDRFTSLVEEVTGRSVVAYMSQVHTDPDMAVELFVLEPGGEGLLGHHEREIPEGVEA